ncbi:MAG: HD domain-containing protein [Bdellovibrio sp.]|nr:MAG: HD domain-containing protein [Bdellovibrio sp.]
MKQFIKDLKEKDRVNSVFFTKEKHERKDKNGKVFLSLNLQDATGEINARVWEKADIVAKRFNEGDCVKVKGFVQVYKNRKQLVVNDLNLAQEDEYVLEEVLPGDIKASEQLYEKLIKIGRSIANESIKRITLKTLQDPEVHQRLLKAPAAKSIHHAYLGGLLAHMVSVCEILDFLSSHYSFVDRDLLIFGGIFHDLGKIWELEVSNQGIQYSRQGRLVGHMSLICEWLDKEALEEGIEPSLHQELKHIILSHHDQVEFGSPVEPQFLEAQLVALVDKLDSRMDSLWAFMKREVELSDQGEEWSRYHEHYGRYFYLPILRKKIQSS